MKKITVHPSMRGYFAEEVWIKMKKNKKIYVLVNDLGFGMWDRVRTDFPDRFINVGAAEQSQLGMAVGLALEGKIPLVYSITSFLLFRPFETIRNYINYEKIPVKLIASGRDRDYLDDGFTHWAEEDKDILKIFKNIKAVWPKDKKEIPALVSKMLKSNKPWYINLSRY